MKKKPTSYIIWGLAIMPLILSVLVWVFLYATRVPYKYDDDDDDIVVVQTEEIEYQEVDKAVLYLGDEVSKDLWFGSRYDSCTVEGSFRADTLIVITSDKSLTVHIYGKDDE